jgi:hypothetical protein
MEHACKVRSACRQLVLPRLTVAHPPVQISMLWNWYTVDSCFLSTQWHIRSKGTD